MKRGDLLALLAGAAFPLAFAPFGQFYLAPLCLAALYHLCAGVTPRRGFWRGWLAGLGMFGVGVSWVQVSVHQFGLPLYSFSVTVTALFVMFISLYPALALAAIAWLRRDCPAWLSALTAAAVWTLAEWLRGLLFTGFPWLLAGYSQTDSWLAAYAPLGGALLVSFVVALIGTALVELLVGRGTAPRAVMAAQIVLLLGGGVLAGGLEWTSPAGAGLRVAIVQGNVPQARKWLRSERGPTLALYAGLSERHWDADLVVWPETAIPAFPQEVEPYLRELAQVALQTDTALLLGMPTGALDGGYYNSVVALGEADGRYDKHHLVPFGEYLPFRAVLGALLDFLKVPMSSFSPGAKDQAGITAQGMKLGVSICYEDAYASEVGRALPGAALLVNVSNDAWFGTSVAPPQHLQIARMRAIEASRYLVRATNNGISAVLDQHGSEIARIGQFREDTVTASVVPLTGQTPFTRLGNGPLLLLCLGLVAAALSAARRGLR